MKPLPPIPIGTLLVYRKMFGLVKHYGVYVGPNTVLQNTPEKGEHLISLEEFCGGKTVRMIPTGAHPADVMARARKILANPKKYDLVNCNCEHTASETVHGKATSPQLILLGLIFVAVAAVILLPKRRA